MTAFDRAWNIAKENRFQRRMKDIGRGRRSLPKDTKFSDLRSTSDEKPEMPQGVPISIFELKNYRPSETEIHNQNAFKRIMGTGDYGSAVNQMDNMRYPESLKERTRRAGRTPKND